VYIYSAAMANDLSNHAIYMDIAGLGLKTGTPEMCLNVPENHSFAFHKGGGSEHP